VPTTPQPEPGARLAATVAALARWSSREDVRRRIHAGFELPETAWWLLQRLADEPARASDLAVWQGVDRSTITPQVQRLADAGLIERRPDPHDGRAVTLAVTAKGRAAVRRSTAAGAEVFGELLAGWDPGDREAFVAAAERFAAGLR
jgi:DNA-binding MarR family transcriptional regulator